RDMVTHRDTEMIGLKDDFVDHRWVFYFHFWRRIKTNVLQAFQQRVSVVIPSWCFEE
ncbi:hypothetical protein D030_0129B, partial [Vibrio parahaemolyticus AQ3810]